MNKIIFTFTIAILVITAIRFTTTATAAIEDVQTSNASALDAFETGSTRVRY